MREHFKRLVIAIYEEWLKTVLLTDDISEKEIRIAFAEEVKKALKEKQEQDSKL